MCGYKNAEEKDKPQSASWEKDPLQKKTETKRGQGDMACVYGLTVT